MKNTILLVATLLLLVVQSALSTALELPVQPMVALPVVLTLGMTPELPFARGALLAAAVGVLSDVVTCAPFGLMTFFFQATYMLTRMAAFRLFTRGVPFQIGAVSGIALLVETSMLALVAILGRHEPPFDLATLPLGVLAPLFGDDGPRVGVLLHTASILLGSSLATGLVAPPIHRLVVRIETWTLRVRARNEVPR